MVTFGNSSTWSQARFNNRTPEALRFLSTIMFPISPSLGLSPVGGGRIKEGELALALVI